ncbi:MAG TPA: hypothetical protein VHW64_09765 [Nocardioides sp.]|uniref:hypothetical protein n=1 Tax=Nocardioides sp. TaxID=35761 RepID=UPI002E37B09E|nr:hypothetical protein [Nocardioides sp.]HEX3930981.1 hypothetical protein [Nocardioides sp.]
MPRPEVVTDDPVTVRRACLPGGPCPGTSAAQGETVGAFLGTLHDPDPTDAVRPGALDVEAAHVDIMDTLGRMERAPVIDLAWRVFGAERPSPTPWCRRTGPTTSSWSTGAIGSRLTAESS